MTQEAEFWQDDGRAKKILKELDGLKNSVEFWFGLQKDIKDAYDFAVMAEKDHEESVYDDIRRKTAELKDKLEKREFEVLLGGKYDGMDAVVSVHAGSGGVDAQDFAQMLERMLLRYAESRGLSNKLLHRTTGEEAGIKSSSYEVSGYMAYGYFRSESGVHRLVRQSPFDADAARHTSFALVEIVPLFDDSETKKVEIKDEDLRVDTFRASGAGGQHVNKTDSAVRLTYIPENIVVECQAGRSQAQNKETALKLLKSKLLKLREERFESRVKEAKGAYKKAMWGNQIRSYVLHPYKMVKDHRTNYEESNVDTVLDGKLDLFAEAYLKQNIRQNDQSSKPN